MTSIIHYTEKLKIVVGDLYGPLTAVFKTIGVIVLAVLIIRFGSFVIRKFFEKQKSLKLNERKISTMSTLALSIFRYAVYLMAAIIILTDIFKMASILAAAGIGGIAVGLGAQSLIKDIISGFFIVFEDQFAVGDLVTVEGMNGTVEQMELRVTKLRNFNGDLYIIPNGEIRKVVNHTRGDKAVIVDIPVSYSSDMTKVINIAQKVCSRVESEFTTLVEAPKVLGVTELGKGAMNLRIFAKALPNTQWEVERRIRLLIQQDFLLEKIEFYDRYEIGSEGS